MFPSLTIRTQRSPILNMTIKETPAQLRQQLYRMYVENQKLLNKALQINSKPVSRKKQSVKTQNIKKILKSTKFKK